MEVETICRYKLPVCIVIFNNDGIYRGTDVNSVSADPATTVFVKGSRYDKMMEAFGGVGVNATSPDELKRAVNAAMDSGKPTLINAVIDPAAGSESGRIGNLNPQSALEEEITGSHPNPSLIAEQTEYGAKTMTKALKGVRILDFTHVQSGPTCTQLLAWFGADVIKVERPGVGDITRGQLQDIPNVDSLYFTMLNHNKRSITLDTKNPKGKEVLTALIKTCDVLVENFGPGVLDRMGFPWEKIQSINPKMIVASIKGFGPGPYEDCKVYENVAQCTGGAASTTGFRDGLPLVTGAQIGDSGTGLHLALGIVTALYQRTMTGQGQKVTAAMQDGVLNLARVKLRDQQRLAHGPLKEYSQFGEGIPFGDAVPRAGNDSGGGQPGRILKCKGWETDPNAYIYFITQAPVWEKICDVIGEPGWKTHPDYAKPPARLPRLNEIFARIEQWTMTKTKFEAMDILNKDDIPCGPILSMKEIDRGPVAARHRHRGRGRSSDPRQVFLGRQSDQDVGQPERGDALAAARRAHRRDPAPGARLLAITRSPRSTIPARSIRRASRRRNKPLDHPRSCKGRRFPAAFSLLGMPNDVFMLQCKRIIAAMQTNPLSLVSGIPRLSPDHEAELLRATKKGTTMSKTAAIGLVPSSTLFGRLLATIDRLLMASAQIAIRNGDLPHFGL